MNCIQMNESLDELKDQNKSLENELNFANKCLNVLIEIKINLNRILDQRSVSAVISLTTEDIEIFNRLEEKYKTILEENNSNEVNEDIKDLPEEQIDLDTLIQSAEESQSLITCNQLEANQPIDTIILFENTDQLVREEGKTYQTSVGSQPVVAYLYPNSSIDKPIASTKRTRSSRVRCKVKDPEGDECVVIFKSGPKSDDKDKRFKCNLINCYQEFESRPRLVLHQKECHKDYFPFKCTHEGCDSIFRLESKLKRHIEGFHYKRLLKCQIKDCDHEFETTISLMTHQKECHKDLFPFQCVLESCESIFRKKTELIRHLLEVHKKRIKCPINGCDYETDQRIELRVHQQKSHNKKSVKQFNCKHESCGSSFRNNSRLQRHIVEVHMNERRYTCPEIDCGKSFKTNNALKAHQIIHSDETPFKCEFQDCTHSSKSIHRLKLHQRIHSNDRPFVCEFEGCVERFKTKLTLQSHMNIHSEESPIPCPVEDCGKYFKPHLMRAHVAMHSKQVLTCDWPGCQYATKGMNRLRAHHKLTHSGERNFVCTWIHCDKRFKTNHQLRHHYRMHTNEKPYACQWPGCEYRSSYSANIRIHARIHKNEKPFPCQWPGCEYRCTIGGNLKKHMRIHQKV